MNDFTSRVREVAKHIAEVETRHGDFGDDHFKEGTESGEDTELILVETKAGSGAEVSAFHN